MRITSAMRRTSTPWCSPTPPRSISRSAAMRSSLTTRRRPAAVRMKRASASGRWRTASRRGFTASTTTTSASRMRGCSRRSRTRPHRNRAASTCTTGRVALWRQAMRSSTPASVRSAGRLSISRFRPPPRRRALRRATFSP